MARGNAHRVFRVVLAGARWCENEERSFAALRMTVREGGFRFVGESWARFGWLCFGAGEMVGYTSRPVGAWRVFRVACVMRWARPRGCRLFGFLYLAILFAHKADCIRTRWRSIHAE